MAGELSGRVALIAGGGGEIGGAIARRFAEAGAAIAIADINRDSAEAVAGEITAAGGQAVAVRTNVAIEQDAERAVRHAVEAFGKLTTLVNVAATVTPDGTVETLTLDDVLRFRNCLEANKKSYDIHIYRGAPHGWLNDTMPGRYRKTEAEAGWAAQQRFLAEVFSGQWDGVVRWQFASDSGKDYDFSKNVRME